MKKIVIYYSLTGNSEFIAKTIASAIGAEILALKPEKEIKADSPLKFLWGGKQVMMKEKPALLPIEKNPADYDLIILGTPVWAFNFAPPIRSFLASYKLVGKKVALFCCHGGQPGKTLDNLEKILTGNEIIGKIDFLEPIADQEKNRQLVIDWTSKIIFNE